ncbi:MAG TPA: hypothetical protein VEI95_19320 [Acidobacteriota bacterium]|nr:hypothetical protein [Acidobacteriota bacterium]
MVRGGYAAGLLGAALVALAGTPASAEVRDAVYRGTMVCDKLPFSAGKGREAIEVTIAGGKISYTHIVRLYAAAETAPEKGEGRLNGDNISLQGSWKGGNRQYEAKYSGAFVRRHVELKGTQTWNDNGKTITRACSGTIKRPFKVFLPGDKK